MNDLLLALFEMFGRPHQLDAPEGPRCRCGEPSKDPSGWCGSCTTEGCSCQKDKLNRLVLSHDCPKHSPEWK